MIRIHVLVASALASAAAACVNSDAADSDTSALFAPEPAPIEELFIIGDSLTLFGTQEQPLYTDLPPLIRGGRIYVTDHIGHRIYVFDAAGTATGTIGRKGSGDLEFEMPNGLVADSRGYLYINDRGNSRVQVLDPSGRLARVFMVPGQNEQLIVDEHGAGVQLIVEGVARCPGAARCLLTRYAEDGTWLAAFAPDARTAPVSSWTATTDAYGRVYIANVHGDTVVVYSRAGREVRRLSIATPTIRPFSSARRETPAELMAILERLRTEPYTVIRSLTVLDSLLVVSWQRRNWPDDTEDAFVADVFDLRGRLQHRGIPTPGFLHRTEDGVFFIRHDDTGHGSMEIRSAGVVRSIGARRTPTRIGGK